MSVSLPRICIVTEAHPFSWAAHYVRAFRKLADVRTAGPSTAQELIARWGYERYADAFQSNDIPLEASALDTLEEHLPDDWQPHAVVVIPGNAPLLRARPWPWPTAYVSVDTWQQLTDYEAARACDFTFVAQREFVPHLQATGAPRVAWLPLGADPDYHVPVPDATCTHDIGFAGSVEAVVHQERARLVDALRAHFDVRLDSRVFGADYPRALAASKIAFNHCAVDELNMRVFEAMAAGRMLLTNRAAERNGLLDLFREGEHLVSYADEAELIEKTRYYLEHADEREAIAQAGRDEVLGKHTYVHRAKAILAQLAPAIAARGGTRGLRDPRLALLSSCPGRVLDLGANLQDTRYSLCAAGATCFEAVAPAVTVSQSRYDAVTVWPAVPETSFDTVILSAGAGFPATLDEQLRAAHRSLADGGVLLMTIADNAAIPDNDLAFGEWLRGHDFHLVHVARRGSHRLIRAARRSQGLKPILLELGTRYPIEGSAYPEGYLASLPDSL